MRSLSSTAEQLGPNLLPSTLATGAYGVFLLPPSMATRPQLQREETVLHLFTFPVQAGKEKKGEKKGLVIIHHFYSHALRQLSSNLSVFNAGITCATRLSECAGELLSTSYNPSLISPIERSSVMKGKEHVRGC